MASRHLEAVSDADYGNRRLVVIAVFDVVGFSAIVEADEDRALAWWLLQGMRSGVDHGNTRAGGRPRGQLPLFIA